MSAEQARIVAVLSNYTPDHSGKQQCCIQGYSMTPVSALSALNSSHPTYNMGTELRNLNHRPDAPHIPAADEILDSLRTCSLESSCFSVTLPCDWQHEKFKGSTYTQPTNEETPWGNGVLSTSCTLSPTASVRQRVITQTYFTK